MLAFPHSIRLGRRCNFWITSSETGPILALIEKQKTLSLKRMNQLTRRKLALKRESQSREDLAAELLVDAALFHAEADICWLELCEAKISEAGWAAGETRRKTVFFNHDPAAA
jgi:hypothetical protein